MVVRCVPGLESIVQQELRALSVASSFTSPGTVFAKHVSAKELYASNALLRCATRILVPACSFVARSFADLELACKRLAREDALLSSLLVPGARLRVRVQAAANSPLFHTAAVAERIARHLHVPAEPSFARSSEETGAVAEPPEQRLDVLVDGEWVKILVDASGEALHDRGWRQDRGAKMPLKESVAAGLLHSLGWAEPPDRVGAAAARPMAASATRPKPTKASREAAKEYKYAPRPIMDENYKIINADVAQGSELAAFYKEKGRGFRQEANAEKEAYRKQQQAIEAALAGRK